MSATLDAAAAQSPRETAGRLARPDGAQVAWRRIAGTGPTVVWLGGYRSDMGGTKAEALAQWAVARGRGMVRFDYFGHGESSGDFLDGTISRWRDDALTVIDWMTEGTVILVGSSMGGWLACLCALARPKRVAGMVLVAPAMDFTDKLVEPSLPSEAREALRRDGVWMRPSDHAPAGDPFTARLLEDGRQWSVLPGPISFGFPIRFLQGAQDPDVPWTHGMRSYQALEAEDVVFTLIRDGDHRLSRPQDLRRLIDAVEDVTREGG